MGIRVEMDEAVSVLADLKQLMMELQNIPTEDEKSSLYYLSLEASVLQLYSLCMQGYGMIMENTNNIWERLQILKRK